MIDATQIDNYKDQWETALLAGLLSEQSTLPAPERTKLLSRWIIGVFNGASFAAADSNCTDKGVLDWRQAGPTQYDLIYTAPYGIGCSLARVYEQPGGSWAALVIAGVKDELLEAIGAAEWAIARLSA